MDKREKILTEVYNSKIVDKMAKKLYYRLRNQTEDYISFIYETICTLDEDKLIKLYDKGELYFYIVSICKNQVVNDKSDYNRLMENNIIKTELGDAKDYNYEF